MSSRKQHTAPPELEQLDRLLNEQWEHEIVPNLLKQLEDQARTAHLAIRSMIWVDERSLLIAGEEYSEDGYLSSFM
jgi:hypothetical protein